MPSPNILLIHADQFRHDCLGVAGHPLVQTPHLDRLAADGVRFTHAFTPIPVCTPARASLLTGTWPARHGFLANAETELVPPPAVTLPTFTALLHQAGYFVGHVGKWHVHPRLAPTAFGCDLYVPERGYHAWRAAQGLPPKPFTNGFFGETDPHITPEQSALAWGADQTIATLATAAESGRPFFLRWDPSEPHLPNVVPEPYASLYSPTDIPPWPGFADPLTNKPYIQHKQRRTWGIENWTWSDWAPIVARYLGEITLLDHQVGRILAALDHLGLRDNTLVVFSADHGDLCGSHGLIDKHYVMYDDLVRVPLLLRWPTALPASTRCDAFVCAALDLAHTFLAVAGLAPPESFAGRDLRAEMHTPTRHDIYAAYYGNQMGLFTQRMVRDRAWKYVWNATAEDELYDLAHDPAELTNLVEHPIAYPELQRLRSRLLNWLEQTRDPVLNRWTRRQLSG